MVEIGMPPITPPMMPSQGPPTPTIQTPSLAMSGMTPLPPSHPPREQLANMDFCVNSNPSWPTIILLAFQHYIVMLGTIVMLASFLVPQMGGNNGDKARVIQALLFMSGINTLLQSLLGTRLPTVMNASFVFIVPVLSITRDFASKAYDNEHERFLHTIRAVQGAMLIASFVNILIGYTGAWAKLSRYFSPVTITPAVCLVGLGLFERGFPQVGKCVEFGLPMLILLVVVQQYLKHINQRTYFWFERYSLLLCVTVVWAFAAILTAAGAYNHATPRAKLHCRTDSSHLLQSASWIKIPYPFQWGAPIFTASHSFGMMGAVLVSAAESTGAHYAAARLSGATVPPGNVLSRSVGLQGIGMLLESIFGALAGSTAAVENVGLLGLTRIGSRRAVQISTCFMIFFSIFGKFGALFASIPLAIFAATYCLLFGLVASVGISFMQFANSNSTRNLYILGLTLFLGISVPQYFNEFTASAGHGPVNTNAGWFNDILNSIFASAPTVAIIVGTLLDNTLDITDASASDRGLLWWHDIYKGKDVRNDEFYSYPIKLHEWIPSRFID